MPAIVLYLSRPLRLRPPEDFQVALGIKIVLDCNDLLMEITNYNGNHMWTRERWEHFEKDRLVRWIEIFEATLKKSSV